MSRRPHAQRRTRGRIAAVVATTCALLVLPVVPASQAVYAPDGVGRYGDLIDWMVWGDLGDTDIPPGGRTSTQVRDLAGQTLTTTCTVVPTSGSLKVHFPGDWHPYMTDPFALDVLYNRGGLAPYGDRLYIGLYNAPAGSPVTFDLSCGATLDGVPVPISLVMAEAERIDVDGFIDVTATPGVDWQVIERYREPGCAASVAATYDGTTFGYHGGPAMGTCDVNPVAVVVMADAAATVTLGGSGDTAVAFGVAIGSQTGGAPGYAEAGSLVIPRFDGGGIPPGGGPVWVNDDAFVVADPVAPVPRLGGDVGAVGAAGAIAPPGVLDVRPGQPYTLEDVACTGPGFVAGWVDWNGDGAFGVGERSGAVECGGASVDLTWTVPGDVTSAVGPDSTYLRLRIGPDEAAVDLPIGYSVAGEVEDHEVHVLARSIEAAVTVDGPTLPEPSTGDEVTYLLDFENTADVDAAVDFTAHLDGVLDDAELTAAPTVDGGLVVVPGPGGDTFRITGTLAAAAQARVTIPVAVRPDRGDDALLLFLVEGADPVPAACVPGSPLCASTPVSPPGPPDDEAGPPGGGAVPPVGGPPGGPGAPSGPGGAAPAPSAPDPDGAPTGRRWAGADPDGAAGNPRTLGDRPATGPRAADGRLAGTGTDVFSVTPVALALAVTGVGALLLVHGGPGPRRVRARHRR